MDEHGSCDNAQNRSRCDYTVCVYGLAGLLADNAPGVLRDRPVSGTSLQDAERVVNACTTVEERRFQRRVSRSNEYGL